MNKHERERIIRLTGNLESLGFTLAEIETMRKASRQLSRWCEAECNGEIQRDEETDLPFRYYGEEMQYRTSCRDMERAAKNRLNSIISAHPGFDWYYQTDPRGCAVYLYRHDDVVPGTSVDCSYSSIGIAIW